MTSHRMTLTVHSKAFGDVVYNIRWDGSKGWIGGNANGTGETFIDTQLHKLLARIGVVLETTLITEGWNA